MLSSQSSHLHWATVTGMLRCLPPSFVMPLGKGVFYLICIRCSVLEGEKKGNHKKWVRSHWDASKRAMWGLQSGSGRGGREQGLCLLVLPSTPINVHLWIFPAWRILCTFGSQNYKFALWITFSNLLPILIALESDINGLLSVLKQKCILRHFFKNKLRVNLRVNFDEKLPCIAMNSLII